MAAPAILMSRHAITAGSLRRSLKLLRYSRCRTCNYSENPGNTVCQLTPATRLGREYLNSPRTADPVNSGNCNSNSTRYNTTLYSVTLQPDTDPRALEYLLTRADVLHPITHFLTLQKLYLATTNCWQPVLAVADDQEIESIFSKELAPYYLPHRYPQLTGDQAHHWPRPLAHHAGV